MWQSTDGLLHQLLHADLISLTPLIWRVLLDPPAVGWYDFRMVRREITLPWRWVRTCRIHTVDHTDPQTNNLPKTMELPAFLICAQGK